MYPRTLYHALYIKHTLSYMLKNKMVVAIFNLLIMMPYLPRFRLTEHEDSLYRVRRLYLMCD